MTEQERARRRTRIEAAIRGYFAACNAADRAALLSCFTPDAVHYFPRGSPFGAFVGAAAIARGWIDCVERFGSRWTIDDLLIDVDANRAVIEWTHWQPKLGRYVRGDEWYVFNEQGLITEIRAYYACPAAAGESHELGHYPYAACGYALEPPG
jgi:ketosteroid isomerase-like protein